MSILSKLFTPIVRSYSEATTNIAEESAEKSALNTRLSQANGIDGVLDIVVQEKKDRKSRDEKKALRDQILSL